MSVSITTNAGEAQDLRSSETTDAQVHHLDEGYLVDFLTDQPIKDTPKEQVRQRILRVLFHEYQFDPEDMQLDFPVKIQTEKAQRTKRIDIAVFAPGSEHTEANIRRVVVCNKDPKRGKSVVKLRTYDQMKSEMSDLQDHLGA